MILWLDSALAPAGQMARDAALLARAGTDPGWEAVLRVFAFEPHGITLGYAQRPERELDLGRCARDRVPWAVRPTGGRAIFHAEEWTYSVSARIDDPRWGGDLGTAYLAIGRLLAGALRRLGVPAEHAARRPAAVAPARALPGGGGSAAAAPCFASTARHEIVLGARKLVGSAQRRTGSALLQQGSILLGRGHLRLADYLAIPDQDREAVRARLAGSVALAGDALGARRSPALLIEALALELGPHARVLGREAGEAELLADVAVPGMEARACAGLEGAA